MTLATYEQQTELPFDVVLNNIQVTSSSSSAPSTSTSMDQDVQMGGTVDDTVASTDSGVPVTSAPDTLILTESNDAPVTSASVGMDMDPPTIAGNLPNGESPGNNDTIENPCHLPMTCCLVSIHPIILPHHKSLLVIHLMTVFLPTTLPLHVESCCIFILEGKGVVALPYLCLQIMVC